MATNKLDTLDIRKTKLVIDLTDNARLWRLRKRHDTIPREVFDFRVNDKNLRDLILMSDRSAPDVTTGLQSNFIMKERKRYVNRLLGKAGPDLHSGRIALLVCPIDGDLVCDTVGCRIKFDKKKGTVTWYDFAWDGNSADDTYEEDGEDHEKVKGLDSFTFDENEYGWLMYQILDDLKSRGEIEP